MNATLRPRRLRPPAALKPLLLPFWNGGHRLAWNVSEYLGAVRHGRFGRCVVCGRFGPWPVRRRVIPPKLIERWGLSTELAETLAEKESSDCAWCGATLRSRRIARVLLDLYPVSSPPAPARSVVEWVSSPEARALRVAEVNRIDGLHEALSRLPRLAFSDFQPAEGPDAPSPLVRSEDLMRLSYREDSFDLLLTSETLEHVPDLDAALSEVRRVLVPGGRHLFTVPVLPGVPLTYRRTIVRPDGTLDHRAAMIRHPGGDVGYPVFTEFGADFPDLLRRAGFEVDVAFGPVRENDLAQVYISRKPATIV